MQFYLSATQNPGFTLFRTVVVTLMYLGQILQEKRLIDKVELDGALVNAQSRGMRIGEFLVKHLGFSEESVFASLAQQFALPFITSIRSQISTELLRELPLELFKQGRCFPLYKNESVLGIVVDDPLDLDIVLEAACVSGLMVDTSLTTPSEMKQVHALYFKDETIFRESAVKISREYEKHLTQDEAQLTIDEIKQNTESEPVVKMVSLIFDEAIKLRASDIHIEPLENNALIRFRIDGMLRQHMELTKWMYSPLTSRVKILADLDIAEKRMPQDGRIRYTCQNQLYDFRVSTLPTHYGEKTVIRILKHDVSLLDLKNLGIDAKDLKTMKELIEKPQGMIFVTGPTGSGKSSTLFACLNQIKNKEINITTIENPIEYKLEGINQVQINEKAGVTFASTLRSILRQDPDVILVGEIRDPETAKIAIQASQTGHLVFSTLHTNDAVSAVTRLKDLGIPGFLVASSLLAVVAQRLVRVLCPECRMEEAVGEELRIRWNKLLGEIPFDTSFKPVGCKRCGYSGYSGRNGIFEIIQVNDTMRAMIAEDSTETEIRSYLHKKGFETMINNGIQKIKQGVTSADEVLRVVMVEQQ